MSQTHHTRPRVLIVDDDEGIREVCRDLTEDAGMLARTVGTTEAALSSLFEDRGADVVVSDLRVPEIGGMALVGQVRKVYPDTAIIMVSAFGTIELAVRAIHSGVIDFITKPFGPADFQRKLKEAASLVRTGSGNNNSQSPTLDGESPEIESVRRKILAASNQDCPVLICGETGTGKELVARAIHSSGPRAGRPFVPVDCGALTPTLIESELFGHETGAFTGAARARAGLFEAANSGTLFLDEIGELPKDLQSRLLRVLQEKEVRRLGATQPRRIDVRIVAATNRDLAKEVRAGRFREDLYFRVNVLEICLPPLRNRLSDIPLLVKSFLKKFGAKGRKIVSVSPLVWSRLFDYSWPGNVRELENKVARAIALGSEEVLREDEFDLQTWTSDQALAGESHTVSLQNLEESAIRRALKLAGGNKSLAADLLGISRTSLYRKLVLLDCTGGISREALH